MKALITVVASVVAAAATPFPEVNFWHSSMIFVCVFVRASSPVKKATYASLQCTVDSPLRKIFKIYIKFLY